MTPEPMHPLNRAQQFWLLALLLFWSFFGMTGRDAWKAEEALALGPVLDWLRAGVPPATSPSPLFTLLASACARLTAPWLNIQDGARLASGLATFLTLSLSGLTARRLFGPGYGAAATLALLGAFGLFLRAHALLPETTLLMAYALLLYGVALSRDEALAGGLSLAVALVGIALGHGIADLAAALFIIILPLLSPSWTSAAYRRALGLGLAAAAALLAAWAGLLYLDGGNVLAAWWQHFIQGWRPVRRPLAILELLSWFAWPLWPLALWTLWNERRRLARRPELHPLLAAAAVSLALAHWPAFSGGGSALPLLLPLALLAAHGIAELKRGAAQALYWFGVLCFLFFILAFWVYFAAIEWGWPSAMAARLARLTPAYRPGQGPAWLPWLAAAASLLWLAVIPLFPRAKVRPVLVWASGMVLIWLLLIALFRPWAEASWGYRPMLRALATQLPANACLRADVDPAMRVMLRLHLGPRYRERGDCRYWLLLTGRKPAMTAGWPVDGVWSGFRPRSNEQRYILYRRAAD